MNTGNVDHWRNEWVIFDTRNINHWLKALLVFYILCAAYTIYSNRFYIFLDGKGREELKKIAIAYPEFGTAMDMDSHKIFILNGLGKKSLLHKSEKIIEAVNYHENKLVFLDEEYPNPNVVAVIGNGEKTILDGLEYARRTTPILSHFDSKVAIINHEKIVIVDLEDTAFQKEITAPKKPYKIAWANENSIIMYSGFDSPQDENANKDDLFLMNISTGEVTTICGDKIDNYFRRRKTNPLAEYPICLDTPEAMAIFGPAEKASTSLIAVSPNKRFYFYHRRPENLWVDIQWIEGYDSKTGKTWKVKQVVGFLDNF